MPDELTPIQYYTIEELLQDDQLLRLAFGSAPIGDFGLLLTHLAVELAKLNLIPKERLYEILKPLEKVISKP